VENLDLTTHDPEEYEGKVIAHNGCEYVVGKQLGSGAEKITHKLVNRASGLCLHVLKIWRRPRLGYTLSQLRARLAARRTAEYDFAKLIPVSIEITLPGGRGEMQIYVERPDDESTRADVLADKGDALFKNSRFEEAIAAYGEALAENPKHTRALVNSAAARAAVHDLEGAYNSAAKAARIEPNYPLYRRAVIHYLAAQGLARLALNEFRSAQRDFPNVFDFNDIGAELFLVCGEPESAVACAQDCLLDTPDKDRLIAKSRAAVEARSKAQALFREAQSLVQHADPARVLPLLKSAREIDQCDPLLASNLGLTLARAGRPREALPLLLYGATHGPLHLAKVCYANASFCAMENGELQVAMILLDTVMAQFNAELDGRQLKNLIADLPGKGIWMDEESIMEEKLDSAARLVLRSVQAYGKESTVPPEAAHLASLYAKAMQQ